MDYTAQVRITLCRFYLHGAMISTVFDELTEYVLEHLAEESFGLLLTDSETTDGERSNFARRKRADGFPATLQDLARETAADCEAIVDGIEAKLKTATLPRGMTKTKAFGLEMMKAIIGLMPPAVVPSQPRIACWQLHPGALPLQPTEVEALSQDATEAMAQLEKSTKERADELLAEATEWSNAAIHFPSEDEQLQSMYRFDAAGMKRRVCVLASIRPPSQPRALAAAGSAGWQAACKSTLDTLLTNSEISEAFIPPPGSLLERASLADPVSSSVDKLEDILPARHVVLNPKLARGMWEEIDKGPVPERNKHVALKLAGIGDDAIDWRMPRPQPPQPFFIDPSQLLREAELREAFKNKLTKGSMVAELQHQYHQRARCLLEGIGVDLRNFYAPQAPVPTI